MRRSWLVPIISVVVLTGCGSVGVQPAATVEGVEISRESLDGELDVIDDNDGYRALLEQSYNAPLRGLGIGTFDTSFVAQVLTFRIYYSLIEHELERRGGSVTAEDLELGAEQLEAQYSDGPEMQRTLSRMPASFRQQLARQQAIIIAVQRVLDEKLGSARQFYEDNLERFEQVCASHILVAATDDTDADVAKAEALQRRLAAGETFAAVATAESADTGSAPGGGDLGCNRRGTFVDEFDEAVFTAPIGVVTGPVETQFGQHLILVSERPPASFEASASLIAQVRSASLDEAINQLVTSVACGDDHEIDINACYGSWDRSECETGGSPPSVRPPRRLPAAESTDDTTDDVQTGG